MQFLEVSPMLLIYKVLPVAVDGPCGSIEVDVADESKVGTHREDVASHQEVAGERTEARRDAAVQEGVDRVRACVDCELVEYLDSILGLGHERSLVREEDEVAEGKQEKAL